MVNPLSRSSRCSVIGNRFSVVYRGWITVISRIRFWGGGLLYGGALVGRRDGYEAGGWFGWGTAVTTKRVLKFAEFALTKYAARRDAEATAKGSDLQLGNWRCTSCNFSVYQ